MAMHLITGHSGTAHISAADDGALNAAIMGDGSYVLDFGDRLAATMTTANSVTIGTGALVHQGRKAWCSTSTKLTIQSGAQSQKRNDLVVARYTKSGDVEDMQLVVIKGNPVSYGSAADPSHNDGSVIDGATVSDFPLWRIPIDGITPGTPVRLFDVTPSLATLRDSVCRSGTLRLGGGWQAADNTTPQWRMLGDVVIVTGHVQSTYQVNPAAEDPVFNLPYPSAEYSYQAASAGETYMAGLLSHTGDTEVCLFRSDKSSWPSGSKIMLNGMAFRVSPGEGV